MPLESTISATRVEIEQIQDSIEEMLSKKVSFKKAYDIKNYSRGKLNTNQLNLIQMSRLQSQD